MRVLVNLTWLVPGTVGGSEESTTDALRALLEHEPSVEPTLAVLPSFAAAHPDLAEACPTLVLDNSGSLKASRVLAEQTWLARRTRELRPDVVHHAGGVMPLRHPGRTVLTIHDLQPLDLPENFSLAKRTYLRTMIGRSARAADVVAVPSHFTARRVSERLGVPAERIEVVPWSVVSLDRVRGGDPVDGDPEGESSGDGNPSDRDSGDGYPGDGDLGDDSPGGSPAAGSAPIFLYPAITYPHKNHLVLLEAFALYRRTQPDARLVLAGGAAQCEAEVTQRIERPDLAGSVERPGRVPRPEMERLYRSATAVLVPSRYEGFGLPALEAMSRGVPLVVASAGSLPEVVGATSQSDATAEAASTPDSETAAPGSGAAATGSGAAAPGSSAGGGGSVLPVAPIDPDDTAAWAAAMETVAALGADERRRIAAAERAVATGFTPRRTAVALALEIRLSFSLR